MKSREGWEDGTPPPHRDVKERSVVVLAVAHPLCKKKERKQTNQTRDGRTRTRSPPARAGSWKDDQGHRGTGVGSASRHGGGLGRVHPHDRVPGVPLSYRTKSLPAARGQARASYWLRSPSSPALLTRDSDRLAARCSWTPFSTGGLISIPKAKRTHTRSGEGLVVRCSQAQ